MEEALGDGSVTLSEPLPEDTHVLNSTSMSRRTLTDNSWQLAEGSVWSWRMWAEVMFILSGKEETPAYSAHPEPASSNCLSSLELSQCVLEPTPHALTSSQQDPAPYPFPSPVHSTPGPSHMGDEP